MSILEYFWFNFNNVIVIYLGVLECLLEFKELRLEGNKFCLVLWIVFCVILFLRVLDFKYNRIEVFFELVFQFLINLIYFDLFFNRFIVVFKSVFSNWSIYQKCRQFGCGVKIFFSMVLVLYSNFWLCDCRLRGFVQFVKFVSFLVIFVNFYLMCRVFFFKAGQFFYEIEFGDCMKLRILIFSVNVIIWVGQNVILRCLVQVSFLLIIVWIYFLSMWREFDGKLYVVFRCIWGNGEICSSFFFNREVVNWVRYGGGV